MSWMKGTGPVKDVSAVGITRGLSEDWYSDESSKTEIKKGNFWDIIDNPLYQVAAEAKGYEWAEWIKEAKGKVGTGPNDGMARVRAVIKPGTPAGKVQTGTKKGGGFIYTDDPGTPAEYEWMTKDEAKARGLDYEAAKTTRWRNKETGKIHESRYPPSQAPGRRSKGLDPLFDSLLADRMDKNWKDNWEELRDWGVHDEGVAKDLDKISGWLNEIVSINDHLPKIIREGPKGEHYGIEGDIWEHYGLDKEPEPPKELEWDSYDKKMNLATVVKSEVGYSTPEGITPVDLHGD